MAPQTAFYNMIGMETLGLRMERACSNAKKLAEVLHTYPDITVNYPGLADSKWHEIADRILSNGYGAILTIRVGSKERAYRLINSLTIHKGEELRPIITSEKTLFRVTDAAIQFFDDNAKPSERFQFTIERVGIEKFKKVIEEAYHG